MIYEDITEKREARRIGRRGYGDAEYKCLVCSEWFGSKELRTHATREAKKGCPEHKAFVKKHTRKKMVQIWEM